VCATGDWTPDRRDARRSDRGVRRPGFDLADRNEIAAQELRHPHGCVVFRLPRAEQDRRAWRRADVGHAMIVIDRGDYYQCAYIIPKGSDSRVRAEGIESLQRTIASLVPQLADRVGHLTSFDDVKLLDVELNRLHRWYTDGLLLIETRRTRCHRLAGRINLAVADAVATARALAAPLRAGRVTTRDLARIQARRWVPTALIQGAQRAIHAKVIAAAVERTVRGPTVGRAPGRPPAVPAQCGRICGGHRAPARTRSRLRAALNRAALTAR